MPDLYLNDTRRIRVVGGLAVVEYYDIVSETWEVEKKPVTLSAEPWLLDVTAVVGLNPAPRRKSP